jgi:uncharacterized phiE125 gp8 family phage protein
MSFTKSVTDKGVVSTSPGTGYVVDLLTLAETLNYLKQDYGTLTVEDDLVKDLIQSARMWIEQWIGQSIIKKTIVAYTEDELNYFILPLPPIQSVASVYRVDITGSEFLLTKNLDYYEIGATGKAVCTYPVWSTSGNQVVGLKVTYDAYMSEIPKPLKEACLALVSHMYYNRGADVGMPAQIIDKLRPFRMLTL